ncbi:hypothetical protein DFH08DRAFT_731696 [Mycena albidolilacea]|uniref:Flavin-containing monooxygenase n=1 Tax=Mycena albidolilacea TaxID=1033008 RepID=A0AAD7ALA0_9AGAR|nr:hypothetical protein DFH08DRAFT_731696 [Mycena albidolilacea]
MPDTANIPNVRPKRILIIGGGASGLVTLRNLLDRGEFDDVQLVERRDDVGGVWYLDDDPNAPNERPISAAPRWPSPAYPGLIGNVLPEFLSFSAFLPFPEPSSTAAGQPFPSLSETHAYLRAFAAPLLSQGLIRLSTEVCAVEELGEQAGWHVRMRRWAGDEKAEEVKETWDAVVVATAFYDHLVFPETPGIAQLRELGLAQHAQSWRVPDGYEGKRILVIGNANSGNDISAQLAPVAGAVFQSIRRPNFPGFPSLPDSRIARVAPVKEYVVREGSVVDAHLTDGTVISDLDGVLFGTGYHPFPDFVRVLDANTQVLVPFVTANTSPPRVPDLHRYVLYARNPTLAFVGTAVASYTPFTIADISSTWLALAWTGAIAYPTALDGLLAFERERLAAVVAGRIEMEAAFTDSTSGDSERGKTEGSSLVAYGVLGPFEEEYAGGLRAEVVQARPELDSVLPVWNPERTAVREAMFDKKRAALELARERQRAPAASNLI